MSTQQNEDEQTNSQQSTVDPLEELQQCVANLEEGFYNYNHKTVSDPENHKFIVDNLRKFSQLWKPTDLQSEVRTEAQRHIVRLIGESPFAPVNFRTIRPASVELLPSESRRVLLKEFQKLAQPSNFSYADEIIKLLEDPTNISKLHAAFCCLDSILHHVFVHKSLNTVLAKTFPRIEVIVPTLIQQLRAITNAQSAQPLKKGSHITEQVNTTTTATPQDNVNNNNSNSANNENNNNITSPQDKLISKEGLMLGEAIKTLLKIFGQALSQVRISEKLWTMKSLESWLSLCQFILTGIDLSSTSYHSILPKIDIANPSLKNLSSLKQKSDDRSPYSVWWKCKKWSTFAFYHLVYRSPTLKIRGGLKKHLPNWTNMNLELLSQLSTGKLPWIVVHWCFMYFHQLVLQMIPVALPQVTTLLQNTLLPILGFSNLEYDLFTKNLPLYIRGVRDLPKIDQTDRVRHDVVSLIRALIQQYPNYIYPVLFDYIDNLFSKSSPSETEKEVLRRKEGVLYLIQTTGRKILSAPQYCDRIINSFKKYFIPEFDASCDLIRARVSVIFGVFMNSRRFQHQMGADNIKLSCEKMVKALRDPNLFVADKTAEALYLVICNVNYPSLWQKTLREDFNRILDIFKETGDEAIIDTAENLLGSGEEAVIECAPVICKRLAEDFLFYYEREHAFLMRTRLPEEQGTDDKAVDDDMEPEWSSEYFLNPLQSLVDLCCNNSNALNTVVDIILEKLFPVFSNAIQDNPEIFQDFATMLSVIAFHVQPFRPELWKYFDLLLDTTLQLEYEPEHFSPVIDFMFRDPKTFFEHEQYVEKVWSLISGNSETMDFWEVGTILEQLLSSTTEMMCSRGLSKNQIRNLSKVCNDIVPKIVNSSLIAFKKAVPKNVFEVLLHCCMCSFPSALPVFINHSKAATLVFEFWFNCLNKIPPRMKRLNLFAMCGLFTVPSSQLPPIVQKNMQILLEHITHSLNDIELLKSERNFRWTEQKIHKKVNPPRSPRKRADSRKILQGPPLISSATTSNNNNNNSSESQTRLPEDNPTLERGEGAPSSDSVFSKLGIALKQEKKTEREYSKLFPGEEYGYEDEDEEIDEDDNDEEIDEEDDAIDLIGSADESEELENVPPQPEEAHEGEWSNNEEDFELGSDHSSDMAVGMYHDQEDTPSDTDLDEDEENGSSEDFDDHSEDEDEEDDSDEDDEDQLSSEEALQLEDTNLESSKEKKQAEQEEPTVLDKIDEMVFVYDTLHRVQANLDLIGLLSIDDANMLKEYFEVALLRKAPPPLLDQCLRYVLSNLKKYEDQIKRLPEDVMFMLRKFVISLRINLSDEEIQLLKFNQQ